jgi:transcriptional regulator with XRE-family HTH domain
MDKICQEFFMEHPTKEIKKIAERVREVRGPLSRKDFGLLISESGSNIQKYEKGQDNRQHTIPSDVLIKISKAFKVNLSWLIEGRPHPKYKK